MAQIHMVLCFDTETGSAELDWTTTMSKFHEEYIYRPEVEKWDYPTVEEDKIIDELIPQIDNHLSHFHLDI